MYVWRDSKITTEPASVCPHCMTDTDGPICPNCHKDINVQNSDQQLQIGTVLKANGHTYTIGFALGQGGFGITYVARDMTTNKKCAIKECFPTQVCARRPQDGRVEAIPGREDVFQGALQSFLMECRTLAAIKGFHFVVQILDCFAQNGTAYMVMEYLDGISLKAKVERDGPMAPDALMDTYLKLLYEMKQLHEQGILHRDIAPDNIMLMPDGTVKLLDFGSARSMEDGKSMTVQLKHGFAPVEQYTSRGQGPWTDLYALAATMYYCLTGKAPLMSPERLENDTVKPLGAMGIHTPFDSAIMWSMNPQPKLRPQNVEALLEFIFQQVPDLPTPVPPTPNPAPLPPRPFFELDPTTAKMLKWVGLYLAGMAGALVLLAIFGVL